MRHLLVFFCLFAFWNANTACAVPEIAPNPTSWKVIKYGGRDYLTLGNAGAFYGLGKPVLTGNDFKLGPPGRQLQGHVNSVELMINHLKFILSFPIAAEGGELLISRMDLVKVVEPVLRPRLMKNLAPTTTVVLDAGHGGYDHGAVSRWGAEKIFALDVAQRAKMRLEKAGFNVIMTRATDQFLPLGLRTAVANRTAGAIFVCIHFNSGPMTASGVETFTMAPQGVPATAADSPRLSDAQNYAGNLHDAENMALATAMHSALVTRSQLFDRGIKRARFLVLKDSRVPAVLMEGGFVSSPIDGPRIAMPLYREKLAEAICSAAQNYQRATSAASVAAQKPEASGTSVTLREEVKLTGTHE